MNLFQIFIELFDSGGIIMIPLALVSFLIWYLLADRAMGLFRLSFSDPKKIIEVGEELNKGNSIESLESYSQFQGIELELIKALRDMHPSELRDGLQRSYHRCIEFIHSDNTFARTLINVAPLLGLLGTVMGMVETFRVIGIVGTSEPQLLARGISMAMITTQAGLLIAVPALFIEGRVRRLEQRALYNLEEAKLILMQCFK